MRPTGVTIIGALQVIGGVLRILSAIVLLGLTGLGLAGDLATDVGVFSIVMGVIALIIGLFYFYLGWAMLGMQPWAWAFTLVLNIIAIVFVVIELIFDGFDWNVVAGIAIPVIIVIYLYSQKVREAFNR
jgi:membrane-bound ClpP family serine protease